MAGAKDISWWHDLVGDVVKIQLVRKLDGGRVSFCVNKENIEASRLRRPAGTNDAAEGGGGGPYITMSEETKAMLVLFLCS